MRMQKYVLVTGGTGFLGKHLVRTLLSRRFVVCVINTKIGNLEDYDTFKRQLGLLPKFDYIFHLAAKTKAGDYALTHQSDQWISNQVINTNMLKYWVEEQPQAKLIAMGTSCSYSPGLPMKEENYLLGEPEQSLYTYAMTKRMLLIGLQAAAKQHQLNWLYFIPSTLYGPEFDINDNHFIFDLIRNCHTAKTKPNSSPFTIWGSGEQRRELVYVQDAVDAMIALMDKETNQLFNLGSGEDHSINEFASLVCNEVGYDPSLIRRDLSKYVGVKQKKLDMSKLLMALNEEHVGRTSLSEGLRKTIDYYKLIVEVRNNVK